MADIRNRITGLRYLHAEDILPNPKNFREHPGFQRAALQDLLAEVGIANALIAYETPAGLQLIDGHLRKDAAPDILWPVLVLDVDEADATKLLGTLDPIGALATTNRERLQAIIDGVQTGSEAIRNVLSRTIDPASVLEEAEDIVQGAADGAAAEARPTLSDRFLVPPFSVLDARQGYWQERKRQWLAYGIQSELGRGGGVHQYSEGATIKRQGGTLGIDGTKVYEAKNNGLLGFSEQARSHYRSEMTSPGGTRRDAASLGPDGKTVRGDGKGRKASNLGQSTGQDLMRGEHVVGQDSKHPVAEGWRSTGLTYASGTPRPDEVSLKLQETSSGTSIFDPVLCELAYRWFCPPAGTVLDPFAGGSVRGITASLLGRSYTGIDLSAAQIAANEEQAARITPQMRPKWLVGDSTDATSLAPGMYDFLFTCPPYADLEVYSDDPRDLSTMAYSDFLAGYRLIITACVGMLTANRFACFVVGDVRDKKGMYRNFVSDTISAFTDAGCRLYNEAILITSVGSLPIRVGKQFTSGRKLGKTHQNVLIFVKGDPRKATEACGPVEIADLPEEGGDG